MDLVDRLPRFARLGFLGKYQAQGRLFALGLVAGLLLFLGWWALQPPLGVLPGAAGDDAAAQAATATLGDGDGVLDDITGAPEPGGLRPADAEPVAEEDPLASTDPLPGMEALPPDAEFAGAEAAPVDAPPAAELPMPAGEGVTVRPYYVEVERGPGVSELLRIDAISADQALAILRDFRGDPRVLRGPSPEPLQ